MKFPHARRPFKLIKDCASNFPFLTAFESLLGKFLFKKDHVTQVHTHLTSLLTQFKLKCHRSPRIVVINQHVIIV